MAVAVVAGLSAVGGQAITVGLAQFTLAMATKAFVLGAGLSMISRALQPKLEVGQDTGLTTSVSNPIAERPIIYGRTRTGGTIVYFTTSGSDSKFLHLVIAVAGHAIDGYEKVYFDDQVIWEDGSYVDDWVQNAQINFYDGTQTTADQDLINASSEWNSNCILNDTAYIHVRLEYDPEVYTNGIPSITTTIRGKQVYDPRTDVTEWSENPALCIYDYLKDPKYGLNDDTVNLAQVIASANVCDQMVTIDTDVDQTRYALSGFISSGDTVKANIEKMLSSMFGRLVCTGGELFINAGYYTSPVLDIDESMLVGEVSLQTKTSRRNVYNAVKGTFLSEEENYIFADYPSIKSDTYSVEDGEPLYLDLPLPCTTNNVRAQRLAKLSLNKSRQQRSLSIPVNLAGLKVRAGDVIRFTSERLGISNAEYEVIDFEFEYSDQLIVNLVCVETGSSLYDWTVADKLDFSVGSDITLYDGTAIAPTGLTATAVSNILSDGTDSTYIDVAWTNPSDIYFDYVVLKYGDQSIVTKDQTYRINNVDENTEYTITISAYNTFGRQSTGLSTNVTTVRDTEAPADPSGFSVTGELHQILLSWTNPTDDDFDKVRIKSNTQNDESTAIVIAELRSDNYIDSGYTGVITKHYWMQAVDRTGNASDYVYAGTGTTTRLTSDDFSDDVITLDFVDTAFSNKLAEIDLKAPQSQMDQVLNESQQVDDKLDLVSERMLTLATRQNEFTGLMRDAGITVDPDNGTVSIQAVESLRAETSSSLNEVGITLEAQEASINLKASTTYVNNAIASAVLDSADLASLNALELQVNQAEIDIDALEGEILLKADTTQFNGLDLRLSQAELDINSAQSNITLKVDQSEFDDLSEEVSQARIDINALDAPSITQTVVDTRRNTQALDKTAIQNLKDVIGQYKNREKYNTDLAFARRQIFADVNDQREATATARTELGSLIDENKAQLISESQTRATEDSALSSRIDSLTATVGGNSSSITDINFVSADSDSAIARKVSELDTTVTQNSDDVANAIGLATTAQDTADGKVTTFYQDTAPTADGTGDLWIDTNDKNKLYRWDGSAWVEVRDTDIQEALSQASTAQDTADGKIVSFYQNDAPTTGTLGDLWIDTNDNNTLYRHNGTTWVNVRDIGISEAIQKANTAQDTADGKITTFFQDAEPTGELGDLWVDTNDDNKLYRFTTVVVEDENVDQWVEVRDAGIQQALDDASNAQSTADGKIVSFYQDDEPSTASDGDLWIDTNDGNKLYVYSDTVWNSAQDAQIVTATTTLTEQAETIDGIKGQYAISINNNGSVAGFGLISELINDEVVSGFAVSADKFYLTGDVDGAIWDNTVTYQIGDLVIYFGRTYEAKTVNSNKAPSTNPSDWDDITSIPFAVYTTDTLVTKNGETTTIPAGVYIEDAYIQNLSVGTDTIQSSAVTTEKIKNLAITTAKIGDAQITNAKINDLNADKITAGFISADRIESGTLDAKIANIGWAKITDVSIENADITSISADKITAGTISTDRLSIDGVTLDTNASGQLVISNEGVDTAQIKDNAVIEASDAYTSGGISNLANGTKEVQDLTIQATGAPVQVIATARISVSSGNFSSGTVIIKRDGTTIRTQTYSAVTNNSANETVILRDTPSAGSVKYTVEVFSNSSSSTLISGRYLQAMETKK